MVFTKDAEMLAHEQKVANFTDEDYEKHIEELMAADDPFAVTVTERPPVVMFHDYYSERMHLLKDADPTDLMVIAEVGEIVDVFTSATKAFTKVDEALKAKVNEIAKANGYEEGWETYLHVITPNRTNVPTPLCLDDDEYRKTLANIVQTDKLLKDLKAKQKEIEARPGYSTREIKGYSRRERK